MYLKLIQLILNHLKYISCIVILSYIKDNYIIIMDMIMKICIYTIFFDILINNDEKIGIKILDYNITDEVINYVLNNNEDVQYVVVFDSHHYLTFKKIENEFTRVADIPYKSKER